MTQPGQEQPKEFTEKQAAREEDAANRTALEKRDSTGKLREDGSEDPALYDGAPGTTGLGDREIPQIQKDDDESVEEKGGGKNKKGGKAGAEKEADDVHDGEVEGKAAKK